MKHLRRGLESAVGTLSHSTDSIMTDLSAKKSLSLFNIINFTTSAASLSLFLPIQPAPTWFLNNTNKAVASQLKAALMATKLRKLALVIHQVHLLCTSCCHPALWIPLLSSSPKDTSVLCSFAPHKVNQFTDYSHLKWGSKTEEHTRNGFNSDYKLSKLTEILFYWNSASLKFCFTCTY